MSIAVCVAINLIFLSACVFVLQALALRYLISCVFLCLFTFNLPLFGWSACAYIYALFDVPSLMLVFVCLWWLMRFVSIKTISEAQKHITPDSVLLKIPYYIRSHCFFPPNIQYTWIILGIFIYIDFLGYGFIDIYHLEFKIQIFLYLILSLIAYHFCSLAGYGLILSLLGYQLEILGQMSIFNYCIDPFLWAGCIIVLLWRLYKAMVQLILHYGRKNGKKMV